MHIPKNLPPLEYFDELHPDVLYQLLVDHLYTSTELSVEFIKACVESGAPMTNVNCVGNTLLHIVAEYVHNYAVLLQKSRVCLEGYDDEGIDFETYRTRCHEIVKVMINAGYDVDARNDILHTPLYYAVHARAYPNMIELLKAGADYRLKCRWGTSPLKLAIMMKDKTSISILKSFGASRIPWLDRRNRVLFLQRFLQFRKMVFDVWAR